MSTEKSMATRLFDASVRVETMFWLPGIAANTPDEWRDFIEDDLSGEKDLFTQLPWLKKLVDGNDELKLEPDEFPVEFYRKGCNGYIVNLARPIPTQFHKGGGYSFSWDYYQCRWFYFETLDALCDHAEKWSEEVVSRAKKKARAK